MKKSKYSEEQMVKILREADRAPVPGEVSAALFRCLVLHEIHRALRERAEAAWTLIVAETGRLSQ
ncbi:MAG: hypothetical protein ABW110_21425 [Steroidobacteraceae bacterium]